MGPLQGVGVLVTRPADQAEPLCRALEAAGADVLRLPALDILPVADFEPDSLGVAAVPIDVVIFTSANAVRFGAPWVAGLEGPGSGRPAIAAIGPATARALVGAGLEATLIPAGGFDSEALLRHPALATLDGRRVLLVKGVGGRELVPAVLRERGADVVIAEVYRRRPALHSSAALAAVEAAFADGRIQVVTATSAEIVGALIDAATPALRESYQRARWLVPSARVADSLRQRGLGSPLLAAPSAEDQDLVSALIRWRACESGA